MKTVAVRFEGTISTARPSDSHALRDLGEPREEPIAFLRLIEPECNLIIVSTAAQDRFGRDLLHGWLQDHKVPYTEIHDGSNLPTFDYMVDDAAHDVSDKSLELLQGAIREPALLQDRV